ncbi:uncharacterized protein LOC114370384 isoform X6 [Glycine soja]|nr:uncharacterized protein LOC114370384 isoform X6 [Glycine soja]
MESTPDTQTPSLWTDEKHLHYLNTMEASFVRTMLHHYAVVSPLRLDRYLPDTSESTLDSKPKKQATAGTPPPRTSLCLLHQIQWVVVGAEERRGDHHQKIRCRIHHQRRSRTAQN